MRGAPLPSRPGRHARRPPVDEGGADLASVESDAGRSPVETLGAGSQFGEALSAVPQSEDDHIDAGGAAAGGTPGLLAPLADRLPLPVRAALSALPAGVRNGSAGLQASHAVVLVLVVALGLAVTALLTGIGRPRVAVIEPAAMSTVLATGTPVAIDGHPNGEHDPHHDAAVVNPVEPAEVVVHVTGRVVEPGIVVLPAGSRVVDAVGKAGGLDGDVDLTTLNLARVLTDGEQIFVGIDPPPGAQVEPATPGSAVPGGASSGPIDLNAATAQELESLPGIGPALAQRIVQWREQNGRFTAVDELLEVAGIGPAKYGAIAELVAV